MIFEIIYIKYLNEAKKFLGVKTDLAYIKSYIELVTIDIIDTTYKYIDEEYYISQDRAMFIAENEANVVGNYKDMLDAIKQGCKFKTWKTMKDLRVRHTHVLVDEKKIGIHDAFKVGNSEMMFPKDNSLGAESEEIVNCRCVCKYSKE